MIAAVAVSQDAVGFTPATVPFVRLTSRLHELARQEELSRTGRCEQQLLVIWGAHPAEIMGSRSREQAWQYICHSNYIGDGLAAADVVSAWRSAFEAAWTRIQQLAANPVYRRSSDLDD